MLPHDLTTLPLNSSQFEDISCTKFVLKVSCGSQLKCKLTVAENTTWSTSHICAVLLHTTLLLWVVFTKISHIEAPEKEKGSSDRGGGKIMHSSVEMRKEIMKSTRVACVCVVWPCSVMWPSLPPLLLLLRIKRPVPATTIIHVS